MPDDTSELRVDDRGRVTIPKEMREEVGAPAFFIAEQDGDKIRLTPARLEPQVGE